MWKAAFTGRSEKGDKDRDTAGVSGRSEARRKKSSRSVRGDVDDTASVVSGSSRRHRSSRHESSSRYGDDEDRDRMKDSSYYSGPSSVYGSAATYASPGSSAYATAPTSRVGIPDTRPLTASALRMLPDDDDDEWEDDDKTVRSERRKSAKKRSPSDERDKRRKSSGKTADKEYERKRSSSGERKEKKRSSTSEKAKDKSRRNEPELVTENSRAIPPMGSFEQFPGQYGGGMMGQHTDYTMSGALPNAVPQSQFPGQDYTAPYEQPVPPHVGITRADSYGHAADYYLDEGQSVAHQPGNRASTPNMLVNPDHHLMAASSVPNPAQDTGNGSAADFYNNATSFSAPVTPAKPSVKPAKQSSFSASKPSKISSKPSKPLKPSRTSSASAVAAGLAGVAGVSALGKNGKNGKTSHQYSQSEQTASTSLHQGASVYSDYPPTLPSMNSHQRPSRHASDGNVYYAQPTQTSTAGGPSNLTGSAYGASHAGSGAYGPNYENTYGTGNISGKTTNHSNAGLYAAGAAAAGTAAYGLYQHHQHGRTDSNMAIAGDFGGNGQGPPRSPRPSGFGSYQQSNGSNVGSMMQQGHFHEHKGPMTKLKDGLLNLISTPEDVAKMEMYTEYIGVCKHCFDPRTSAWDAPRVHHYHKRRDSFESLRRRSSRDKLRRKGSYERVDKESRYYTSDSSRRRREERHSGMGLAGAGLAAVGTGLAANALFNDRKNFDDTYSVKSGHRESSAVRRQSRSSSRERRRRSQYGTIRPGRDDFANVTIRKKDGTVEHRRVARSRSGSGDRKSGFGFGTAAAAGAALGAAGLAASARRRSRSSSRDRRRRSTRVSPGRSQYSQHERDDRRKSEEGGGGIFGNFFSPPRKQRRNSREHQKKRGGFFTFSNGSSSSSNSELAFGGSSFVSRNGSKTSLSRKSSGRSTRGRAQRKSSDQQLAATLAGIGATAAALTAAKAGNRISKRTSRPELGARRHVRQHVVGDHQHGSPGSSAEDGWEDELPSDDGSSADGLAFGDSGGRRLSGRQSLESVASQSSAGGLGAWGWRWGGKDKKARPRRSASAELPYPDSRQGSSIGPIGAGIAAGVAGAAAGSALNGSRRSSDRPIYLDDTGHPLPSVDARSSTSAGSSQPMRYVDPKPVSESGTPWHQSIPGGFDNLSRVQSMPGAFEPDEAPIYRPGSGVVQHPQPMSPARPAFTQPGADQGYIATAGAYEDRPVVWRTQSSPVQSSWGQDAALIGAGVLGAGAIIAGSAMSSARKSKDSGSNVRFGLTEEQERKESRSTRRKDQEADEERRRSDRTRALKDEAERAAKDSREDEVLRAREVENRARAQARLDLQREQERKEAEEARLRAEQRAREERERQLEIERLEKEAVNRQAAAAAATAEFERQRNAREEAERHQAEVEKQSRERDHALRQQYQLAEDARREDEERRQWEAERYAREYQESAKRTSARGPTASDSPRDRHESDANRKQSSGWGPVAAGVVAAAGIGAAAAGRQEKKRRESGKSDSTDETPISRRAPRTSVDWNADIHSADREAAKQAELDRQAREQYGHASRGSVEMKNGYVAAEIKPGSDEQGEPIMDDDIFDPDFFMRSQHTPAERARREELARKAADKVVADQIRGYSPDSRPKESYADFFADEIKDVLAKKPGEKERSIQPDSDVQVYHVEGDGIQPPFTLRNDLGGKNKHAPYGVPRLNVIAPTPPPGSTTASAKGSVMSSPLSKAVDADGERDESPESSKDSGKSDRSRSISWGEDKTHIYDVQTPESYQEKDRDSYITSPDIRGIGTGIAAAAGAAVAGAALHDIIVEDSEKTTSYKDDEFSTVASSKKSKKDKKKAKKNSKSHSDDADSSFLDGLSNKDDATSSFQDVPPERGTEAPYKENGFSRSRKDNERDRQQHDAFDETSRTPAAGTPGTLPHPVYQQPFFDSVSDFSGYRPIDSPGTEGAPPVRGFVEGEIEEPTPVKEKRPHIPGGFEDDGGTSEPRSAQSDAKNEAHSASGSRKVPEQEEEAAWQPPLSKKDKKKRDKEAKRAGSGTFDTSEPSTPVTEADAAKEPAWEPPLTAKEKKKRDKEAKRLSSSTFDVESVATTTEPEEAVWEAPLSAKEQKKRAKEAKRASVAIDPEPSTTPVTEREAEVDAGEPPLSAKERKKREKAAKKAGIDPAYSEEPTPVIEAPKAAEGDTDEYFPSSRSKKDKKTKAKQFEEGLERIASTTSAVSMPSWSGDTVVSDVTAKPPSPELTKPEQRGSTNESKKVSGFSFADVTDTILASGGVAAAASALNDNTEDPGSGSTSKKGQKRKKKSDLGEGMFADPGDEPSGMPGGWDSPERLSSGDEPPQPESAREVNVGLSDTLSNDNVASTSAPVPPESAPVQERDPWSEWSEPGSNKKSKKKSKRSSVAFDSIPQVSSPLRSEIAWDDYIGANDTNGDNKAQSEAARSDPITVIERKSSDEGKGSRKASKDDDFYDPGQRVSGSPRDMSPEDARSVASSADADRESRRKSRRDEARRGSDYYDQPDYAYETQPVTASELAEEEGRKKHKRRSKHEDDDTMSVSSSRRRSRHADEDDDTRSVTSSRSRRDKEESPSVKKEKKGIFGSLFSRKSTDSLPSMKEAARDTKREEDDEERHRRKKKHRDSEYGDDDDDTRSVKSESHRRRHRSSDDKQEDDSRERRRRSTHDDDGKNSESGSRHHRRRRTDEDGESLSRHQSRESRGENGERPKHHRRRTDEDKYDSRDQSFLGNRVEELPPLPASRPGSPDQAVERMEGRPLEAGSGTGLVSVAAAGLAAGIAVSALSSDKRKMKKSKSGKLRESSPDGVTNEVAREEPLPSAAAHSFPLPYVPEEASSVVERDESTPLTPAPVLEKPSRPVSIGRPGSSTTVPVRLPGHAPHTPGGKERTKSLSSPITSAPVESALSSPATPHSGKSRQGRPHSSDLKSGIMPLYLVERSRPIQEVEDSLPSLPSSKPSSRASSVQGSDEYESAREELSAANSPDRSRSRSLTLDTVGANEFRGDGDILDSQQTTPKASEWPQTAIPWSLPSSSGEKKEKQEPQFYTWEDFARDERMHEQQDNSTYTHEDAAVDSRSRSKSPSKAKAMAAAAMLGTAAVYAAHKVGDRSPERVLEAVHDEPLPSSAAHSFPLPYVPEPVQDAVVQGRSRDVEPPHELGQAFEPVVSSKKSKKTGKKGQKLQASDAPVEPGTAVQGQRDSPDTMVDSRREIARNLSEESAWSSVAAQTSQPVSSVNSAEPSPEKEAVSQSSSTEGGKDHDFGYLASTAAHSMPVYQVAEVSHNASDDKRPVSAHELPELKSEPAPLVEEQRNVEVQPNDTTDLEAATKFTRKQSKKDKKRSKRTSVSEDEPQSQAEMSIAGQLLPADEPLADTSRRVEDIAASPVKFGLADFGTVAGGAATAWSLSQADAFRKSMEVAKARDFTEISRDLAHEQDITQPTDNSEGPVSKKQSKKDKKKAKLASMWDDEPQWQDQPAEAVVTERQIDPVVESTQVETLDQADEEPIESQRGQAPQAPEVDDWATPSSLKKKKSKRDKKKAAAWTEPETESASPVVVVAEQKTVDQSLTDDLGVPVAAVESAPTQTDNATLGDQPRPGQPVSEILDNTLIDEVSKQEPAVEDSAQADDEAKTSIPTEDLTPAASKKRSKKEKRKSQPFSWDDPELKVNDESSQSIDVPRTPEAVEQAPQVDTEHPTVTASIAAVAEPALLHTTIGESEQNVVPTAASQSVEDEFLPTASRKQSKRDKKKKALSWHESPEEEAAAGSEEREASVQPIEQLPAEGHSAEPAESIKEDESPEDRMLAAGSAGTTVAAAVVNSLFNAAHDDVIDGSDKLAIGDVTNKPHVEDSWTAPSSKKKSKKDKKNQTAFVWDEPAARDVQTPQAEISTIQDPQTDNPMSVEVAQDDVKPSLSRKQSKKDKKKQKSLAWETNAGTTDAAGGPASEIAHEADREAAAEEPQPTATPDDSFHDAEDFFDAPTDADPWHDAEETKVEDPSIMEVNPESIAEVKQDEFPAYQNQPQAPVEDSWVDSVTKDTQAPGDTLDTSAQQSNLVDDVFGIASGTGDLSTTLSNNAGDREEIMVDRGMEFEPERASEDMDAFGDPTPRDPAEWTLGTSKRSGKKGKKGRKSISRAPAKSEPEAVSPETTGAVDSHPALLPSTDGQPLKIESDSADQGNASRDTEKSPMPQEDIAVGIEPASAHATDLPEVIQSAVIPNLTATVESTNDPVETVEEQSPVIVQPEVEFSHDTGTTAAEESRDAGDAFDWTPSIKKKKGKKGKRVQETAATDSLESSIPGDVSMTVNDNAEGSSGAARESPSAQADDSQHPDLPESVTGEQAIPAAAIDEPEAFTWAPVSKKDKKKARKGKRSGDQTPQLAEEPISSAQSEHLPKAIEAVAAVKDDDDNHGVEDSSLAQTAEPQQESATDAIDTTLSQDITPSQQNDGLATAKTEEQSKDIEAASEVLAGDVAAPSPANEEVSPSLGSPPAETSSDLAKSEAVAAATTTEFSQQEAELSWIPSSKKNKKGKRASKSVAEIPPEAAEETGPEPTDKISDPEADNSQVPALAISGAAVAAGLLAGSHIGNAPVTEESAPVETTNDDFDWAPPTKKGKKGKRSFKSLPETTVAPNELDVEASVSQHDGPGDIPSGTDAHQNDEVLQTPTAEAEDEWAAVPSSNKKKKKGKKNRQSVQLDSIAAAGSDEVRDVKQDSAQSPFDATEDVVAREAEDNVPAGDQGDNAKLSSSADPKRDHESVEDLSAPLTEKAECSRDGVTRSEVKEPDEPAAFDVPSDPLAGQDLEPTRELSGEITAEAIDTHDDSRSQPPAEEIDERSAFVTSKKKKSKKGKKQGTVTPVEQEAQPMPLDIETEINAEPSRDEPEQVTDKEVATDAVADDLWDFTNTKKKKKGKKSKAAIDWTAEPVDPAGSKPSASELDKDLTIDQAETRAALIEAPAVEIPIAEVSTSSVDQEPAADQAETAPAADQSLVLDTPFTTEAPASNENDFVSFSSLKKKKGKKTRVVSDWESEPAESATSAPLVDSEPTVDQADTRLSDEPSVVDTSSTAETPDSNGDDFASFPSSKKKKKGKKSRTLEESAETMPSADADETPIAEITTTEESQAAHAEPLEATNDDWDSWATPASSKKAKGKNGRKTLTEVSAHASEIAEVAGSSAKDDEAAEQPCTDGLVQQSSIHGQTSVDTPPYQNDGKSTADEGTHLERVVDLDGDNAESEAATYEALENVARDVDVASQVISQEPVVSQEKPDEHDDNIDQITEAVQSEDQSRVSQTTQKAKKKSKRDDLALAEPTEGLSNAQTASDSTREDPSAAEAPAEPSTQQDDLSRDAATHNDILMSEQPVTEVDDFFTSVSSKKKSKKAKKARQGLVEETFTSPIETAELAIPDAASIDTNGPKISLPEADVDTAVAEQLSEQTTDATELPRTTSEPIVDDPPDNPHENDTADVTAVEIPLPETPASETQPLDAVTENTFALQGGKNKKGKGKKARKSTFDDAFGNSDTIIDETTDPAVAGEDEIAPQSTATTSQEPTEAETEDTWTPTSKSKKAKKAKKLQVPAVNAQTEAAGDDTDNLRAAPESSTIEPQPAAEDDSTDLWSVRNKPKKGKGANRASEVVAAFETDAPLPTTDSSIESESKRNEHDVVATEDAQVQAADQIAQLAEQEESMPAPNSLVADSVSVPGAQDVLEQDLSSVKPVSTASRSKKDKKRDKKARQSMTDSWEGTEAEKPSESFEDAFDNTGALVGAAAATAAIVAATATTSHDTKPEDVDEWGSFATKKSKKDKKKARRSGVKVAEVLEDTESVPSVDKAPDNSPPVDQDPLASEMLDVVPGGLEDKSTATPPEAQLPSGMVDSSSAITDPPKHDQELDSVEHGASQGAQALEPTGASTNEPALKASDTDLDFAATLAAGLADSGFDPSMVIGDPLFQRRASPTGVAEADPDEVGFAPSTSKKKRKGKRDQQAAETATSESAINQTTEQRSIGDVDDIVNRTLEGTGFDPALLEKAMTASRKQSPVEDAEEDLAFTTTKRKKNKKGKGRVPSENIDEASQDVAIKSAEPVKVDETALPAAPVDQDHVAEAIVPKPADIDAALVPPSTIESNEHGWLVQDEMDVDAMDKAYKAYKKNKRLQKKLKATGKSAGLSDNPDSSAFEDTERSAMVSEAKGASRKPVKDAYQAEQSRGGNDTATIHGQDAANSSNSKSIVETVFPGLERIKRRAPIDSRENDSKGNGRLSAESGSRGLMHTSEVSQHLPMEVPRTPTSPDGERDTARSPALHQPPWSFNALQEDQRGPDASAAREVRHEMVRDSGYETAKRSSHQTDRSSGEVPAIVRTSSSKESLRQRRSMEPLRVSTPTSPDWNLQTAKPRGVDATPPATSQHERKPSANTPLEPTSKNRASYLFQSPPDLLAEAAPTTVPALEQPSPSERSSAALGHSTFISSEPSKAPGVDTSRERSAPSPTSARTPLGVIEEDASRRHHSRKRSKARAEVGGPDQIKAMRRTETPQAIRAQEQALSPSIRHGSSGSVRSTSNPLSTSDEVFNRLVDPDNDTVHLDRSLSRQPPRSSVTPDFRSGSVVSDRSNASASHFKSPQELRSYSRSSNRSSTPSLRRTSLSGDLRAVSRRDGSDVGSLTGSAVGARASPQTIPFEPPPTPPLEHDELINGSASRAADMSDDVFQGYGDAQQSQVSPTRPPSVRKRQSMHINELESRLDYLVAENRALQEARQAGEGTRGVDGGSFPDVFDARDQQLQAKDAEIHQIKAMLQPLQEEVARLTELSNGLTEANQNLINDANGRYGTLQAEHAEAHRQWQATARELESMRIEHGRITSGMRDIVEAEIATALADKNAEILRLREQLDIAAEQIRAFQVQIQGSKASDWLVQRDEDYFDGSCQKLCQHVQQWVLRFSKMSDNRVCRLSTELNDDKIEARLDNAVLDGSDVDKLLGDRVRRRDVFMSVVMTMVWEYVFTRYLFGMDREQRQKLKALEKVLSDVGPPRAVAHWRATTLTLLSKRPAFDAQCALDTEAVAHEIFGVLCMLLPPPAASKEALQTSLQKVLRIAVDLAIEMRTQRAEYIMLPPLQPEYDTNGDLVRKVYFNASLMNERSGLFSSNEELAAKHSVVKIVLFPLVVKKGDDAGEGDDEIVVCPAQVLVNNEEKRDKKIVRVMSGAMEIDGPIRSRQSNRSLISEAPGSSGF